MADESREFRLRKAKERRHIIAALVTALASWADVLAVIAESPDAAAAQGRLRERFELDEVQAAALLDVQFRRVASLERQRLSDEMHSLDAEIARLEDKQ